ncbi:MAG: bifunctional diaminohydroxyphosphoribosylaminopyrimidine deaminase/5-amino-6-(5-phosphoribosylamino)uracil reductase RibD, partial [Candidatus Neomarinimicrobiota bacterium]
MSDASPTTAAEVDMDRERAALSDERYMRRAMELACRGLPRVSPNPRVGALLVRAGQVVGEGTYDHFGGPHAEITALHTAGDSARGATLYATLEPCCITAKTPPCTEALIRAGIKRAVVAVRDANPRVDGGGINRLRAAGIKVTTGVLDREAAWLNRGFFKWITSGKPYVILKVARTVDNFVAAHLTGEGWFTSGASRRLVHKLRAEVDGVIVGRRTAEVDNPRLTVRETAGSNPRRIVLDSQGRLAPELNVFTDGLAVTLQITGREGSESTPWGE